jgi:hypothetical protein
MGSGLISLTFWTKMSADPFMRLAWFRPVSEAGSHAIASTDDVGLLIRALRSLHKIDVINEDRAHDFVWQHARTSYDLCVYELDNTPAHQFIWPYLLHYSGVTLLRSVSVPHLITGARGPRTSLPLHASRIVLVPHAPIAEVLQADYPAARIRSIIPGVEPLAGPRDAIVESLRWPVDGSALTDALAGFAAARPVMVFDCTETADWPSIDPHDWQRRSNEEPICVAIDPRDEDHSRRVAIRRLREDAALRQRLGAAAQAWWRAHATVEIAAAAFESVLREARTIAPPPRPADWPANAADDGTRLMRELLAPFGVLPRVAGLGRQA